MRSTPLARHTPLKRRMRLRPVGKTAHARRKRDFAYMGQVAKLPCAVMAMLPAVVQEALKGHCRGRVQVDHAFGRYVPDADRKTIPMCWKHHREKTGLVGGGGFMATWTLPERRQWLAMAVAWTRAQFIKAAP